VLELNSDALAMADAADKERRDKGARGPLHGIPVLIRQHRYRRSHGNHGGSLAMLGSRCNKRCFRCSKSCARLEQLFSARPISASGRTFAPAIPQVMEADVAANKNPLRPRSQSCGSSSGSGEHRRDLCAAAVGTETDGSVVCLHLRTDL